MVADAEGPELVAVAVGVPEGGGADLDGVVGVSEAVDANDGAFFCWGVHGAFEIAHGGDGVVVNEQLSPA